MPNNFSVVNYPSKQSVDTTVIPGFLSICGILIELSVVA